MDNILYKKAPVILGAGHKQILNHLLITPVENVRQYMLLTPGLFLSTGRTATSSLLNRFDNKWAVWFCYWEWNFLCGMSSSTLNRTHIRTSEYQNIQKQLARMIHIKSIVHLYPCQCKIWFVTLITHFIYLTGLGGEVFEQLQLPSNLGIILLVLLWMLVLCKICFGFPQKLLSSRESQVSINVAGSD